MRFNELGMGKDQPIEAGRSRNLEGLNDGEFREVDELGLNRVGNMIFTDDDLQVDENDPYYKKFMEIAEIIRDDLKARGFDKIIDSNSLNSSEIREDLEQALRRAEAEEAAKEYKHLNPGVKPIMTCLDALGQSGEAPKISGEIDQIDLYVSPEKARENGFLKEGERAYIISPIDSNSKFSADYKDCTGIVAVGIDSKTRENISFLSHQNPSYFLFAEKDDFIRDFNQRLIELKQRCELGTVDIVIFGGQFLKAKDFPDDHEVQKFFKDEYISSVELLSAQIEKQFGFQPTIVTGPKFEPGQDMVVFDNSNRRLYLFRAIANPQFTNSFKAHEAEFNSTDWKPGEISIDDYLGKDKK